jgi:hypothetical protein
MADKTEAELALILLHGIEKGYHTVERVTPYTPFGVVEYEVDNGWRIEVFVDAGDFDYVEAVTQPGGKRNDGGDELLLSYRPSVRIAKKRWGLR